MSRRSGVDKKLQIPALAKLAKASKMRAKEMWEQSSISRAFSTDYRGIRIKITVDPKTDEPTEISWFLNGKRGKERSRKRAYKESPPVVYCSHERVSPN